MPQGQEVSREAELEEGIRASEGGKEHNLPQGEIQGKHEAHGADRGNPQP